MTNQVDYANRLVRTRPKPPDLRRFAKSAQGSTLIQEFDQIILWRGFVDLIEPELEPRVLCAAAHSKYIELLSLIPFGFEHSSYVCLRTIIDAIIGFTYYRSHPVEWIAVRERGTDWVSRSEILAFHAKYSLGFREFNETFGLIDRMNNTYRELSAYVHCIPPTGVPTITNLKNQAIDENRVDEFLSLFSRAMYELNLLLLFIYWRDLKEMSAPDYKVIIKGLSAKNLASAGLTLPKL